MKKMIFSTFLFVLFFSVHTINGQTLWQGTEYGMTVEQVKSLFPDAQDTYYDPNEKPDLPPPVFKDTTNLYGVMPMSTFPDDPGVRLLYIRKVIVGADFDISFYFKNGLLDCVVLGPYSYNNYESNNDYETLYRDIFLPLSKELSAKYGKGNVKNTGSDREQKWISGNTIVQLRLLKTHRVWIVDIFYTYNS